MLKLENELRTRKKQRNCVTYKNIMYQNPSAIDKINIYVNGGYGKLLIPSKKTCLFILMNGSFVNSHKY